MSKNMDNLDLDFEHDCLCYYALLISSLDDWRLIG